MDKKNLFRQEVIDNKNHYFGSVFINTPNQYSIMTYGFSACAIGILLFFLFGEYSEKFIVQGYLNSAKGVVSIYPNKNGIILSSTQVGQSVNKGEELFLIDTSYEGLDKATPKILTQLKKRKAAIEKEIIYKNNELQALEKLLKKKFIPLTMYHEKYEEIVALEHNKNDVVLDMIKFNQENSYRVRSPINGIITSVNYTKGQYTNLTKPLVKILPHAELIAELFIPVKQSGFLNKHNKLILRYDAYPYERFGAYGAKIINISKSIMMDNEEEKPLLIGQPYYKITAKLDSQFVKLYGKDKRVQHGMTISAVIVGSKRKIWQWILDPVYSFYGGLMV